MVKVNKMISIDAEIADSLNTDINASRLINELLIDYFARGGEFSDKELRIKIKEQEIEKERVEGNIQALKAKLGELEKKEKVVQKAVKGIPNN